MKKGMCVGLLFLFLVFPISGCGAGKEVQETMREQEEQDTAVQEDESGNDTYEQEPHEQMSEIDPETEKELTAQMLEEKGLDVSVVESTRVTEGCEFVLPEDFVEAEDMPGMYVTKYYPIDISTIYYAQLENDPALQLMTEEDYVNHMQNSLRETYGTETEIAVESFETIQIDGYPAFRILCGYTVDKVRLTQLAYVINADKSYVITYSQTDEYDRMEEFEASAATIEVIKKIS